MTTDVRKSKKESENIRTFLQRHATNGLLAIIVTYLVTLNGTYLEDYSNNIIADMSLPLNLKSEQEQDRLRDI